MKRFEFNNDQLNYPSYPGMDEDENGDYVNYSDVQKMLDEIINVVSMPIDVALIAHIIRREGFEVKNNE